ncbi:polysaccharide export protein [Ketobacter nezhaii]|uniref:polysaccharide export protein n=1 Tax=Ketobacter sp. MCCC 1A13808 TaxID=2602738 RepID=UPI0018DE063A|nr:polysaccharide export protein [Ketobacter sp. MCCC 1A13808]
MRFTKYCILLFVISTISACTVVPGSRLNRSLLWFNEAPPEYVKASTEIEYIDINSTYLSPPVTRKDPKQASSGWNKPTISTTALQRIKSNYQYQIGTGDVLTIVVWEHPELTIPAGAFRSAEESGTVVKADGTIFYPYAGELYVEGLTTAKISDLIASRLASVVKNPQIDVRVAGFNSKKALVSGAVLQPGTEAITNIPITLIEAIEQHGGLTEDADWETVSFTRNNITKHISLRSIYEEGESRQNILLRDGDVIHIPRNDRMKIFVLGEVNRPRSVFLSRSGTTLAEALSEANGINEAKADGHGVYVLRNVNVEYDKDGNPVYKAKVFHLDASSAIGFVLADKFRLKPRDVVYVSPAPITLWNRFISQLLPTIIAADGINDLQEN